MDSTHISLKKISKMYGNNIAIENLDLDIERGKFIAIMGPSGCGKSTLLRSLAGLESITSGSITCNGEEISKLEIWERNTPLVWQSLALFPFLTVQQNVEFGLKMRGEKAEVRKTKSESWLKRLGLESFANRNVDQLSGGQRQRVALARCLVTEPSVLLLDEPLSALDAHLSVKMQGELKRLQRELGITFIYVTHSHSEAFSMADKVVIMNQGKIEQEGSPKDIYLHPISSFVANFLGGSSIFKCTLKSISSQYSLLESNDGSFKSSTESIKHFILEQSLNMIVRADQITITTEGGWSENEVLCQIIGEEFIGALVNLRLQSKNGTEIIVQQQQRDMEKLDIEIGSSVVAGWHPEDCYLITN
ncbi:ABC transporter ATP-binding protein [Pelagibaculum spongiae]|uniref:ABC transporter ATP-binding protein n=1 Tax=Pelagibaculum spongiae TaxID=2080658 RepID=A0A2V1GUT4_9GAMM|nr:ABC transporter ATP-binding protein [Pelagibaculum spongiae]PVZ70165.1 ABC transporter ATP-binding protein [Pelagibaculum spongiae]